MTQITKDQENAAAPTAPGAPTAAKPLAEAPARPQPVALEVPVTVNGARTVDGSDKREPFSEKSATVLVFGHGAVIRVSTTLAPGQLVFLTNEKSKKEVVCQVVKSKSDGGAVGYVELRFTEPAPGFWGMRFPADTVLPQAAPRPIAPAPPVAAKPTAGVPPAPTPVVPAAPPVTEAKRSEPPVAVASPVAKRPEPVTPPPPTAASRPALPVAESKPATSAVPPPAPSSSVPSTEELKQQAARLQEQLSSLLFSEAPKSAGPAATLPAAVGEAAHAPETAQKVSAVANPVPEPFKPIKLAAPSPKPASASIADEEIKIPAWLVPLARENDSASALAAPAASSHSMSDAVSVIPETFPEEGLSEVQESSRRPEAAVFGGQLLGDASQPTEGPATGSKKGFFIGIAATLLLVAGAVWYSRQPGNAISGLLGGGSTPAQHAADAPAAAASHSGSEPEQPAATTTAPSPSPAEAPVRVNNPSAASSPTPSLPTTSVGRNSSPVPSPAPAPRSTPTAVEEPKKPSLGDVRLATPKINRDGSASTNGDAAPALLDVNPATSGSAPLSALGASHRSEPAAPAPVGGDVKPAKLLKSVPPVYPEIARSQHVSGNVQIDALIDGDGNVSSMKVLSGPTLLHQSALSALKQWKYQPAELDGKPTAMHLTVTIQFRVQ
jgi:protein TonB